MAPSLAGLAGLRTLADDPTHPLHPDARYAPVAMALPGDTGPVTVMVAPDRPPNSHLVDCPRCHAGHPVDMMLYVAPLEAAQRDECGWSGTDYVCTACVMTAHIMARLTRAALARGLGAPAEFVALQAERDREDAKYNNALAAARDAASPGTWP